MTQQTVIDLVQRGLFTIMLVAAPPLIIGLTVGVIVSVFQTITSIQEPTLAFVPKIVAVLLSIIIFGPFMLTTLQEYMLELFNNIPELIVPR
jgi:flagellar biosynthesis protein FliQ